MWKALLIPMAPLLYLLVKRALDRLFPEEPKREPKKKAEEPQLYDHDWDDYE